MAVVKISRGMPTTAVRKEPIAAEVFDPLSLPTVVNKIFDPYGSCIYCGSRNDLQKEHIVPFGLGGSSVLPRASCPSCSKKTSRFELYVLRGPMWPVRAHLRLKSRRSGLAPKTAPITIVRGGVSSVVEVPLKDHPLILAFPIFAVPSFITGAASNGISLTGQWDFGFGRPIKEFLREFGAENFQLTQNYQMVQFAQLIGKIAWATAAATGDLRKIDTGNSIVSALMDDPDQIGRWVGTLQEPRRRSEGVLHSIIPYENREQGYLFTEVQLFANAGTPRYAAILGPLR